MGRQGVGSADNMNADANYFSSSSVVKIGIWIYKYLIKYLEYTIFVKAILQHEGDFLHYTFDNVHNTVFCKALFTVWFTVLFKCLLTKIVLEDQTHQNFILHENPHTQ